MHDGGRLPLHDWLLRRRGRVQLFVERVLGVRETSSAPTLPPKNDWDIAFDDYGMHNTAAFVSIITNRLNDAIGRAEQNPALLEAPEPLPDGRRPPIGGASNKVFIVHGTDPRRHEVRGVLKDGGLEPILLEEQASQGRTIIEQIEHHGDVGYVVVLMTEDDRGGRKGDPYKKQQPRSRQNVVLELGYFAGRLERKRVAALIEHGVERPSDWSGVVYIEFDGAGGWKGKLASELAAADLPVNVEGMLGIQRRTTNG